MAVRPTALDLQLRVGADQRLAAQDAAHRLDLRRRERRQIGDRPLANLAVLAPGLPQQHRRRGRAGRD